MLSPESLVLASKPWAKVRVEFMGSDERLALAYARVRAILHKYALRPKDVLHLSPKFWALQNDPELPLDLACFALLSAHTNLMTGTVVKHSEGGQSHLKPLVEKLLRFDICGAYLLTEVGHGLDTPRIETTATATDNGFILHTPHAQAAKWMQPASPMLGIPKVAVVFAQLIVSNSNHGIRAFVVPLCDGEKNMCKGISSTLLPPRVGAAPLDFAITTFNNVHLPRKALLGGISKLERPSDLRAAFYEEIWRIPMGTLCMTAPIAQALKHTAYIGAKYSQRRKVMGEDGKPTPILSFATQSWPVLQAISFALVLGNYFDVACKLFMDPSIDPRARHGIAVITKNIIYRRFLECNREVGERCGAQGLFVHNFMAQIQVDTQGAAIADGDILTLSIRIFLDLLLERLSLPPPTHKDTLLAKHASSLLTTARDSIKPHHGRVNATNPIVLQAESAIGAIGHALAYSAALDSSLPTPLLQIFECAVMELDPGWYIEAGISQSEQRVRRERAMTAALPSLEEYVRMLGVERYVYAPIVNERRWESYVGMLSPCSGESSVRSRL